MLCSFPSRTLPVRLSAIAFVCFIALLICPLEVKAMNLDNEEESKNVIDMRFWSAQKKACYFIIDNVRIRSEKRIKELADESYITYLMGYLSSGLSEEEAIAAASLRIDVFEAAQNAILKALLAEEFELCVKNSSNKSR